MSSPLPVHYGVRRTGAGAAELKPRLAKLSPKPTSQAIYDGGHRYRSVYCSARGKRAEISVGLAASWEDLVRHRRVQPRSILPPIEGSVITSSVRDLTLTEAELLAPAEEAAKAGGTDVCRNLMEAVPDSRRLCSILWGTKIRCTRRKIDDFRAGR